LLLTLRKKRALQEWKREQLRHQRQQHAEALQDSEGRGDEQQQQLDNSFGSGTGAGRRGPGESGEEAGGGGDPAKDLERALAVKERIAKWKAVRQQQEKEKVVF
jgi:hypothetical protein